MYTHIKLSTKSVLFQVIFFFFFMLFECLTGGPLGPSSPCSPCGPLKPCMYAGFMTVAIHTMHSTINIIYYVAINFIYVPLVLAVQPVLLLQVFLSVQYHLFFPLYPSLQEDPAPAKNHAITS